jgi:CDP-diacylglycerol--glycerol-3-phosphate 3-phosphatidyltransferase/cardiolipin synthase
LICAPLIFFTIIIKNEIISILLFALICITDILDGKIARKLNTTTKFGAYYDVTVDFAVIILAFTGFILINIYPYWLLIIFTSIFLFFIYTSKTGKLIYDPFGKFYGALLILFVGATLFIPYNETYLIIIILIIILTLFSLFIRISFLKKIKKCLKNNINY